MSMTIPHHHLSDSRLVEEAGAENKFSHVYGSSVRVVQEKFMYNLKDASFEVRNKRRKSAYGSDSLILNPRDLRYAHRCSACNNHICKKNYLTNTVADVRWRRERPVSAIHCIPNGTVRRCWNPALEFARPALEMQPPLARRKFLQRSLTSSEILNPNYRCVPPPLPHPRPMSNSCSAKPMPTYEECNFSPVNPLKTDCPEPKAVMENITEKETFPEHSKSGSTIPATTSSVYSSGSDVSRCSLEPKTTSINPQPMGITKQDSAPVMKPVFGSQYSLSGSQCCQNCHFLGAPVRRGFLNKWNSQSTVGEGHYIPADESNDGLSWRRLHMSRAKLKATATTSELLSGFAMVAMVELQINEPTNVPEWLFIMFSVCTTVLVAVHIFALMISTYLLPNIDAVSKLHSTKLVTESPHERMKGFVELAWAFSTVLGLFLFLVEVAILCWVKFWDFSIRAAMAATIIVIPVLIIFIIFVFHFYRTLVVHKCKSTTMDINELEEMRKKLDDVSPV